MTNHLPSCPKCGGAAELAGTWFDHYLSCTVCGHEGAKADATSAQATQAPDRDFAMLRFPEVYGATQAVEPVAYQWSVGGMPPWNFCDEETYHKQARWPGAAVRVLGVISAPTTTQAVEPVAIVEPVGDGNVEAMLLVQLPVGTKLYTHPAPTTAQEAEPVACEWPSCGCRVDIGKEWMACKPKCGA